MKMATIALSSVTIHVQDLERSIPLEYDRDGNVIQGHLAARAVAPWTPVALEAQEAHRLLAQHNGVLIPDGVDAKAWLSDHADELSIPHDQRGRG